MKRETASNKALAAYLLAIAELPNNFVDLTQNANYYKVTIFTSGDAHEADNQQDMLLTNIPNDYTKEQYEMHDRSNTATIILYERADDEK